jgi:DNA-directed RNA polymerase subunit RPC12/RpoP
MGCCGRKSRGLEAGVIPKGHVVKEVTLRPRAPAPAITRAPAPVSTGKGEGFKAIIQPTKEILCKKCGARLVLKHIWSSRLKKYYDVTWCPGCQKEG